MQLSAGTLTSYNQLATDIVLWSLVKYSRSRLPIQQFIRSLALNCRLSRLHVSETAKTILLF